MLVYSVTDDETLRALDNIRQRILNLHPNKKVNPLNQDFAYDTPSHHFRFIMSSGSDDACGYQEGS